jgi:hypothetical protein
MTATPNTPPDGPFKTRTEYETALRAAETRYGRNQWTADDHFLARIAATKQSDPKFFDRISIFSK